MTVTSRTPWPCSGVRQAVRDIYIGLWIFLTIKTGAGSRVFARNHNLTDIADMISAWRATEQPPGGIGVRETGMPCYETPSLALSVAQVRKNAGDLRRYIIVTF